MAHRAGKLEEGRRGSAGDIKDLWKRKRERMEKEKEESEVERIFRSS